MNKFYSQDNSGNYFFGDHKILVSFIRGCKTRRDNPRYSNNRDFEPRYIRTQYDGPVGCIVALFDGEKIRYGYCRVNYNAGDRFNRKCGIEMAIGRALTKDIEPPFRYSNIPLIVLPDLEKMQLRANKYFRYISTAQT